MLTFEEKEFKKVLNLFEEITSLNIKEYQIKQLAMLLIANTLNGDSAKETAEFIIKKTSEWTLPPKNPSNDPRRGSF
jgi:hypothetical protein